MASRLIRNYRSGGRVVLPDQSRLRDANRENLSPEERRRQDLEDTIHQNELIRQKLVQQMAEIEAEKAKILRQAELQASTAEAEAQARGFESGYAQGITEGQGQGQAQLAEIIEQMNQLLQGLDEQRAGVVAGASEQVTHLAMAISEKIVGHIVQNHDSLIVHTVNRALAGLAESGTLVIRLHPDDKHFLQEFWAGQESQDETDDWRLIGDPQIERGGCVITCGSATVDARLSTQMRSLIDGLMLADYELAVADDDKSEQMPQAIPSQSTPEQTIVSAASLPSSAPDLASDLAPQSVEPAVSPDIPEADTPAASIPPGLSGEITVDPQQLAGLVDGLGDNLPEDEVDSLLAMQIPIEDESAPAAQMSPAQPETAQKSPPVDDSPANDISVDDLLTGDMGSLSQDEIGNLFAQMAAADEAPVAPAAEDESDEPTFESAPEAPSIDQIPVDASPANDISADNISVDDLLAGDMGSLSQDEIGNLFAQMAAADEAPTAPAAEDESDEPTFESAPEAPPIDQIPVDASPANDISADNISADNISVDDLLAGDMGSLSQDEIGNLFAQMAAADEAPVAPAAEDENDEPTFESAPEAPPIDQIPVDASPADDISADNISVDDLLAGDMGSLSQDEIGNLFAQMAAEDEAPVAPAAEDESDEPTFESAPEAPPIDQIPVDASPADDISADNISVDDLLAGDMGSLSQDEISKLFDQLNDE